MDEHKVALELKVEERTAELQATEDELEAMTARVNTIKAQIHSQDLSVEDVRKMQAESDRVSDALEKVSALNEQNKEALWVSETELNRLFERLEIAVESYNMKLAELLLLLESAGRLKMSLNKESAACGDQSQLLGVSLRTDVRPFLVDFKIETTEEAAVIRRQLQDDLDQLEASEEALTEVMDSLQIVEDRKAKCEENMEKEREQAEAALAVRLREVEAIESKIESLRDPVALEEQIARYQRQCNQLEALQLKHQEENISQKMAVHDEINAALRAIEEHNNYVREKFKSMKQYAIEQRTTLRSVTRPEVTCVP
jgi:SMC interacting uncharacterized protein involved in chromosome segregation